MASVIKLSFVGMSHFLLYYVFDLLCEWWAMNLLCFIPASLLLNCWYLNLWIFKPKVYPPLTRSEQLLLDLPLYLQNHGIRFHDYCDREFIILIGIDHQYPHQGSHLCISLSFYLTTNISVRYESVKLNSSDVIDAVMTGEAVDKNPPLHFEVARDFFLQMARSYPNYNVFLKPRQ